MKVVSKTKKSVLLEDDSGYRFFVERETFDSAETDDELLSKSIPYSLEFSALVKIIAEENADDIEKVFYTSGLHTVEDILNNRKKVNDILRRYFSAGSILKFTKQS